MILLGMALLLQASHVHAGNPTTVRVGILAYKGVEAVATDWSHIKDWLNANGTYFGSYA